MHLSPSSSAQGSLPRSSAIAGRLEWLSQIGSTNAELVARASGGSCAHFDVLATADQTAGKGRLGRVWVAPTGTTVAVSVLLATGSAPLERLGWIALLAGLAMTRAVESLLHGDETDGDQATGHEVTLKWPNDVQIDGLKVSGLLAELVPGVGVVIGAGLNLTMSAEQLPTPTATSLTLCGVARHELTDRALAAYLRELRDRYDRFAAADFDADAAGLRSELLRACSSLGRPVRVELPGGNEIYGTATGIDELGRLLLATGDGEQLVSAGDVTHLRHT